MENIRWILLLIGVLIVLGIYVVAHLKSVNFSLPSRKSRSTPRRTRAVDPAVEVFDFDARSEQVADDFERLFIDDALEEQEPMPEPAVQQAAPRRTVAVNPDQVFSLFVLAPPGVPFRGQLLLGALADAKLDFGDMKIFHRIEVVNGKEKVLFSLANIREPGTFDPHHMENFTTEGLALFMQVNPGVDAVWAFEAMVTAARSLANSLDGTACDSTRSVLSQQTIGHMREQVISCQLQQRVAKTAS